MNRATTGFGSVQLAVGRGFGLRCRWGCGRTFPESERDRKRIGASLEALRRAADERDAHESAPFPDGHGRQWNATDVSHGIQRRPSVGWLPGSAHYPRSRTSR